MGGFLSFVKKEALHILRDKRTMLIVLLLPIVQILLFGFAISTEMNNIDFAVVAPNRTETIRQQIERMEANPYFTFKGYISQAEIDDVLRKGDVTAVVVFSEDYDRLVTNAGIEGVSEAAVQFILDASNPNNAGTGLGYLQSSFQSGISVASVAPATPGVVQPADEEFLQFRAGNHGIDFYFDLCHDDFCIYREGKRDRYDGGPVGVAGATDMDHFCQDDSLFFAFVRESCRYSGIGAIRPRSTDVGFDGWFSRAFFALFGAFAGIRVVYFYNG